MQSWCMFLAHSHTCHEMGEGGELVGAGSCVLWRAKVSDEGWVGGRGKGEEGTGGSFNTP